MTFETEFPSLDLFDQTIFKPKRYLEWKDEEDDFLFILDCKLGVKEIYPYSSDVRVILKQQVEEHCLDKARVKEVANKLQEKFDKIYTFEDTIPSMYELLEELGLK